MADLLIHDVGMLPEQLLVPSVSYTLIETVPSGQDQLLYNDSKCPYFMVHVVIYTGGFDDY